VIWGRAVSLVNGAGSPGTDDVRSLRFTSRILSINGTPHRGDTVIDLQGAWILPGLVNAHDHLELNHFGRRKFRPRYDNVSEWIDDMRPRLLDDEGIREGRRQPLTERLFIGALKNVLAGVTTVAHHNPYYGELRRTMPIRVLRRYGWAHSFGLEGQPAGARGEPGGSVAFRWRRTSAEVPFFVHLAEGIDEAAAQEFDRLDELGCLAPNTVLVHGVALDGRALHRVAAAGAGLVWCPGSNIFLFGRPAAIRPLLDAPGEIPPVALGTDSRLTGCRDILEELKIARETKCASERELLAMVTVNAARLLRLRHAGRLAAGAPADIIVIPRGGGDAAAALLSAARRDVSLVIVGGRPLVGLPRFAPVFMARSVTPRPISVDDSPRLADSGLVRRIEGSPISEPGVSVG
jgi:cytosine/adenosine deaminase-related metal-dependent hydrolase